MEIPVILGIVAIALLVLIVILLFIGMKKSDLGEITALFKRTADEQRDNVQKQIANGTSEQFQRFGIIQESVQSTLQANRAEVNEQLGKDP